MIKKFMFLIIFLCGLIQAYAQERTITGKVVDETGTTLPGATVSIKGTQKATATDIDGKYSIKVPESGGILVFTYVGYETQEITLGTSDLIDVNFVSSVKSLDEIVVVGYGAQKKSLVTGSISKIDSRDIVSAPVQRIDQALQGKTSGVFMAQQSGAPGSPMNIRIRGNSSNFNNSPLYIVNGVKTATIDYLSPSDIESMEVLKDAASCAIYGTEGGNGVIIITTKKGVKGESSIEYSYNHGWQTVGHSAKVMNAQEYVDYRRQAFRYEKLKNAADSTKYLSAYEGMLDWPSFAGQPLANTDWQKEIYQMAPIDEHHISFSGGNDKGKFLFSASYLNQDGIVGGPKSNYTRYTFLFNADHKIKDWLTLGSNVSYTKSKRNVLNESSEFAGIVTNAIYFDPTVPAHYGTDTASLPTFVRGTSVQDLLTKNSKGEYYGLSSIIAGEAANPLAQIDDANRTQDIDKMLADVYCDIKFLKDFKFTSRLSTDYSLQFDNRFVRNFYYNGQYLQPATNSLQNRYVKNFKYTFENYMTYSKTFGDHDIVAMAGMSYENYRPQFLDVTNFYVPNNSADLAYFYNMNISPDQAPQIVGGYGIGGEDLTLSPNNTYNKTGQIEYFNIQESYFGRINYNYKEKWLVEGTLRRDGSSLFGPDNHFAVFPSFSLGWNILKEDFMANIPQLSTLKLRFSWGENGSDQALWAYQYTSVMSGGVNYADVTGQVIPGVVPFSPGNKALKWETTKMIDLGLDLGLLKNKLTFTADYYKKNTLDQLLQNPTVPYYMGFNNIPWSNKGEVQNKGWEFEIGYKVREGDFKYAVSINATYLENKVVSFGDSGLVMDGAKGGIGDYLTRYTAGQPAWVFYGYKAVGIFQDTTEIKQFFNYPFYKTSKSKVVPGDVKYADLNDDHQIGTRDRTYLGSPWPKWTFGMNLAFEFKGIDFSAFFQGVQGNKIFYYTKRADHTEFNKPEYFYTDAWHGPGTSNTMPRATIGELQFGTNNYLYSNLDVFSGDYIRLKNITLGYTLPSIITKKIGINKLRLYGSVINLFTITNYPGADPEVGQDVSNNAGGNQQSFGVDRGLYPSSKTYNVGVNVTF